MVKRLFAAMLLFLALSPLCANAADLTIRTGTSRILRFKDIKQIAVGDATILGTLPLPGRSELLVNAKQPGRTTLFVWTSNGAEHHYQVTVTASELDMLAAMLRTTIARRDVSVETFGHSIVLRGTVPDGSALQGVSDVLARFEPVAKQDNAIIVNAVMIAHPLSGLQSGTNGNPYMKNVRVDPDGLGNVIVSGRVLNEEQRQSVLNEVRGMSGRYLSSTGAILDRLAMTLTTQVDVKVYILEIDDTALSTLGLHLQAGTPNTQGQIILGPPSFPIVENKPSGAASVFQPFSVGPFYRTTVLAPTLDLMMTQGHAKVLSAPDLTTVPGQAATFLVGGQIPVPQSAGFGAVSVSYQNYGVQLNVTPTLLGNGDVATKINPEVSDLDFQNGVPLNGFVIPALKTSSISTNVITAPGESIVMGGMLRRQETRNVEKIPFLSQLPIIGRLFQDVRYQRGETNIVFVMTPTVITR